MSLHVAEVEPRAGRKMRWATKVRTGCLTCRQRKLKCDETKPRCKRCIVSRRQCVGELYGPITSPATTSARGLLPQFCHISRSLMQLSPSKDMLDLCYMMSLLHTSALPAQSRVIDLSLALSATCWYMDELPCRAGYEPALDSAAKCLVLTLREHLSGGLSRISDSALSPRSLQAYVEALQQLRAALADSKKLQSAEILCAAQLLDAFEVLIQRGQNAPTRHIRGIYHLIRQRGAAQFQSRFEQGLLLAQVPNIISQACSRQEPPFLAQDDWINIIRSCGRPAEQGGILSEVRVQIYVHNIIVCTLVHDVSLYLLTAKYNGPQQRRLVTRIADGQQELNEWRAKWKIRDLLRRDDHGTCQSTEPRLYTENMACLSDAYTLLYSRLSVSLSDQGALTMEQSSCRLAQTILAEYSGADRPRDAGILMAVTAAHAVLQTAPDYDEFLRMTSNPGVIGSKTMFPLLVHNDFLERLKCPALGPMRSKRGDNTLKDG